MDWGVPVAEKKVDPGRRGATRPVALVFKNWLSRVEFSGRVSRSGAGWMRRRASVRAASLCWSYPVRGGGLVVLVAEKEGIPASQAPYNRMHLRHEAPNQPWHRRDPVSFYFMISKNA